MDIFVRKRVTSWIIVLLIGLNIWAVSMLWVSRSLSSREAPHLRRAGRSTRDTSALLQKKLGLSDSQRQQYEKLRRKHAEQTRPLMQDIRRLKMEMMDEIFTGNPDSIKVSQISSRIGDAQKEIEKITFNHFLDLKEFCGEDQVENLRELVDAFFQTNPPPGQETPRPEHGKPKRPPPGRF